MKRAAPVLFAALLICTLTCPALAAEPAEGTPPPKQTAAFYPAEVRETAEGDARRLEKIYLLSASDDPAGIPTADFDREGWHYTLLDVTRQDNSETDTRDYTETVTLDSKSKDMDAIMPQLAATMEVTTEDGYTGVLTLDTASIKVEAAGYKSSSRTVTATRSYPDPHRVWALFPSVLLHRPGPDPAGVLRRGRHQLRRESLFEKLYRRLHGGCGHCPGLPHFLRFYVQRDAGGRYDPLRRHHELAVHRGNDLQYACPRWTGEGRRAHCQGDVRTVRICRNASQFETH